MKFILPLFLITSTVSAFSTARFGVRQPTLLRSKVDASEAIKEALAASKEFGATSSEARVAWDIVEELDSADNSSAFTGGVSDEECAVNVDETIDECQEYEEKMSELASLLEANKAKLEQVKKLALDIQSIKPVKLKSPKPTPSSDTAAMRGALSEAKDAVEKFGADSTEAKLAWETVEEIASSGQSAATEEPILKECLAEAVEACEALNELSVSMYMTGA